MVVRNAPPRCARKERTNEPKSHLDSIGFRAAISFDAPDWSQVPDQPGVYVIFDREEVIYVGMAGRDDQGSMRRRLRDHASGQVVNMFTQYLLFDRLLDPADLPRTPQAAGLLCRGYIRAYSAARSLTTESGGEARAIEQRLRADLAPSLNGTLASRHRVPSD